MSDHTFRVRLSVDEDPGHWEYVFHSDLPLSSARREKIAEDASLSVLQFLESR